VTGPTGAGKSAFAAALAKRINGEVIGADAFQIYKGLPILTAQPPLELTQNIPHHLVGFLDLRESFDAARYAMAARQKIKDIQSRGKYPILTGGTGLYLKSLTHGLADLLPIDPLLRSDINAMDPETALLKLDNLDPQARQHIDIKNPVRIRRALEIVISTGQPLEKSRTQWKKNADVQKDFCGIVLTRDREDLRCRIAANVDAMFAAGVIDEVRWALSLLNQSPAGPETLLSRRAIGFREIETLLAGQSTVEACRSAIVLASQRYAKRQLTWCRTQFNFPTINLSSTPLPQTALTSVMPFLKEE